MPIPESDNSMNISDYDTRNIINSSNNVINSSNDAINSSNIDAVSIPLALYIHIPWCVKKCPYCDFNSHELGVDISLSMYDEYVDALLLDARMQQPLTQGREISSIFIGGGTPSLLPIAQYRRLFVGLRACFDFADDIEVTMEANPGTLEHAPFAEYLDVGINRLSIGVQSFDADKLKTLGRIHDPKQALSAINSARAAGFDRVNVDLMHGLPQQTMIEALYDIQIAHDAGATHISWYQLTIEPNTVFYRNQPILPDEDSLADIEQAGQALLQSLGYDNYEVSAWAGASDIPCRHNVNYWQFGDYLAIGAGAHGKVSIGEQRSSSSLDNELLTTVGIYRFSKSRMPKDYVSCQDAPKMVGWQAIPNDELVSEFMLNALRLHEGVTWALFEARTNLHYSDIAEQVAKLVGQGLLMDSKNMLRPTALGRRYLNQVLREFL
ncbi:radical SAM family heme chaperone HemW [Psychrobacter sp. LV10R520-6]|uniref:radical SAM family heme chaperone HemW n=1 Tax=Psychrobacter sp. LV10R520-6 TaxID=1415574 RepID=UPI002AA0CFD5|nr:radical SAM family heme chaperone HemW [Psychrobacter sp. LV10R520-6]